MKALLLKLLAGLTAIAALQVPVGYLFRETDNYHLDRIQRAFAPRADALILGDSVFGYSTREEPVPLVDLLVKESPLPLVSLDGAGYTPELQFAILDYGLRQGVAPRVVVASINLRSFGEFWDQGLAYQFSELRARLHHGDVLALGLQRPMSSYQLYAVLEGFPRSEERFQQLSITREGRRLGTIAQIVGRSHNRSTPEARGLAFSLLYEYPLDPSHRKLRALRDLTALCRSKGIPLRFYITPIDVESGERTAGPAFRPRVAANVAAIRAALADQGATIEDWSALFPAGLFSYKEYPNEHLNAAGRRKLADEVLRLIR